MKSKLIVFFNNDLCIIHYCCTFCKWQSTDVISEMSEHSFTDLKDDINGSEDTFDVKYDYKYVDSDNLSEISINKTKLTINGNNHKRLRFG